MTHIVLDFPSPICLCIIQLTWCYDDDQGYRHFTQFLGENMVQMLTLIISTPKLWTLHDFWRDLDPCVKIPPEVWSVLRINIALCKNNDVWRCAYLHGNPRGWICAKIGTTGLLADLITRDIFGNRLGGFDSVKVRIFVCRFHISRLLPLTQCSLWPEVSAVDYRILEMLQDWVPNFLSVWLWHYLSRNIAWKDISIDSKTM